MMKNRYLTMGTRLGGSTPSSKAKLIMQKTEYQKIQTSGPKNAAPWRKRRMWGIGVNWGDAFGMTTKIVDNQKTAQKWG